MIAHRETQMYNSKWAGSLNFWWIFKKSVLDKAKEKNRKNCGSISLSKNATIHDTHGRIQQSETNFINMQIPSFYACKCSGTQQTSSRHNLRQLACQICNILHNTFVPYNVLHVAVSSV